MKMALNFIKFHTNGQFDRKRSSCDVVSCKGLTKKWTSNIEHWTSNIE